MLILTAFSFWLGLFVKFHSISVETLNFDAPKFIGKKKNNKFPKLKGMMHVICFYSNPTLKIIPILLYDNNNVIKTAKEEFRQ